jgi:hypothetical protein
MAVDDPVLFQLLQPQPRKVIYMAHILNKAQNTLCNLRNGCLRAVNGVVLTQKDALVFVAIKCKHSIKIHQKVKPKIKTADHAKETNYGFNRRAIRKDEEVKIGFNQTNISFEMENTMMLLQID